MTRIARRLAPLLALATLAACEDLLGDDGPPIAVSLGTEHPLPAGTVMRVDVGGRRIEAEPGSDVIPVILGPSFGSVQVRARLVDGNGTTLGTVEFRQTFQKDADHYITGHVGVDRPTPVCGASLINVPLGNGAEPDSLFVTYLTLRHGGSC